MNPYSLGEKNGFAFVACKSCGSVMIDPPFTKDELESFYNDVQPQITHTPDHEKEIGDMKAIITKITKDFSGKRFLDIYCRQGYAVMAAKQLGMDAHGIDSHEFFTEFSKSKIDAAIFDCKTPSEYAQETRLQIDLVFSMESFCEQTDLESHVAGIAKLLAPGGKLYIQEPDGNSFWIPRTFTRWVFVDPPLNLNYISKKGMKALLARHGLKIEKSLFTWGPFMRLIVTKA